MLVIDENPLSAQLGSAIKLSLADLMAATPPLIQYGGFPERHYTPTEEFIPAGVDGEPFSEPPIKRRDDRLQDQAELDFSYLRGREAVQKAAELSQGWLDLSRLRALVKPHHRLPDELEYLARVETHGWRKPRGVETAMTEARLEQAVAEVAAHNSAIHRREELWLALADAVRTSALLAGTVKVEVTTEGSVELVILRLLSVHGSWRGYGARDTLVLDATLDMAIADRLFPGAELVVDARAEPEQDTAKIRLVTDSHGAASWCGPSDGLDTNENKKRWNNAQRLRRLIEVRAFQHWQQGTGDYDVVVIAQKRVLRAILAGTPDETLTASDEELFARHRVDLVLGSRVLLIGYGRHRGRNDAEGCSYGLIIGRPAPGPCEVEEIAGAIFAEAPSALCSGWYDREVGRPRMRDGRRLNVRLDRHRDANAEAVRRQLTVAEIEQAVGRLRAVRRTKNNPVEIDVLCAGAADADLTFDEVILLEDLLAEASPARLLLARGIVPSTWHARAMVLRDLYKSGSSLREMVKRSGAGAFKTTIRSVSLTAKGATPLISNNYKRSCTFRSLTARAVGKRRGQIILVDQARFPNWKDQIERYLGPVEIVAPTRRKRSSKKHIIVRAKPGHLRVAAQPPWVRVPCSVDQVVERVRDLITRLAQPSPSELLVSEAVDLLDRLPSNARAQRQALAQALLPLVHQSHEAVDRVLAAANAGGRQ